MKRLLLVMATIFAVACSKNAPITGVAIIPQPLTLTEHNNSFKLTSKTTLVCDAEELTPLIGYIREYLPVKGAEKVTPASN